MAGFIYFIPGGRGASAEALEAVGLNEMLGDLSLSSGQIDKGPNGAGGVLIRIDGDRAPRLRYAGEGQVWRECAGGKFWLGYDREHPPTPEDLVRPDLIDGHSVLLEDGNKWLIPVARVFATGGPPMFRMNVDNDGNWVVGDTIARLKAVEVDAEAVWQELLTSLDAGKGDEDAVKVLLTTEADMCVRALAVNYHLGRYEIGALGLLSPRVTSEITLALIDWPTIVADSAAQKKTLAGNSAAAADGAHPGESPTSFGGADSQDPNIDRPTQTSTG